MVVAFIAASCPRPSFGKAKTIAPKLILNLSQNRLIIRSSLILNIPADIPLQAFPDRMLSLALLDKRRETVPYPPWARSALF